MASPASPGPDSKGHSPSFYISERDTAKVKTKMLSWERPRENANMSASAQTKEDQVLVGSNEGPPKVDSVVRALVNGGQQSARASQESSGADIKLNRTSPIDKIQSHVEMKLKHLKDINHQASNKSPLSASQVQDIDGHSINMAGGQKVGKYKTNLQNMQSSNSLLKTQTLENVTSVVGSSIHMEKLDIIGRNVVINSKNIRNEDANSDIREVSEMDANKASQPIDKQQSSKRLSIVKKINLNPRDVGTAGEDRRPSRNRIAGLFMKSQPNKGPHAFHIQIAN